MEKPETFNFLGFTHLCARRSDGRFAVRRHTIAERQWKKQQQVRELLLQRRCAPVARKGEWLKRLMTGWFNYFGVPGNRKSLEALSHGNMPRLVPRVTSTRSKEANQLVWDATLYSTLASLGPHDASVSQSAPSRLTQSRSRMR